MCTYTGEMEELQKRKPEKDKNMQLDHSVTKEYKAKMKCEQHNQQAIHIIKKVQTKDIKKMDLINKTYRTMLAERKASGHRQTWET